MGCELHGVLKFSQVVGVVPWNLPLRFGRGAEVSPRWNLWGGGAFPPGISNIFQKLHLCQFLMDSKDLYICGSAMTYTILRKNSSHLEFPHKHAAILDFVCFWTFFNKIIFPLRVHHCTIYVIYYDAAYSAEETVY